MKGQWSDPKIPVGYHQVHQYTQYGSPRRRREGERKGQREYLKK